MLQEAVRVSEHLEDCTEWIIQLNRCLEKYPKFYEGYIYRGKLFIKMKKYREAAADFNEAIQINRLRQIAYIGRGDCERAADNYDSAIKFYNQALKI